MQQMTYWQSIIPQHVSGVFTPIIRRADCVPLPMVSCPGYDCCDSGESVARYVHSTEDVLCGRCCLSGNIFRTVHISRHRLSRTTATIARTWNHRQWHAVCSPDDEHKDARNMLRKNWLPINHHYLNLVGLAFICLYKMHGQSSIKMPLSLAQTF
jgi:hypothetical protein